MNKTILFLFFILISASGFAQTITVLDKSTLSPVKNAVGLNTALSLRGGF